MFTCIHYSFPTFINLFEAPQVRCTLVKFKIATAKLPLFFFRLQNCQKYDNEKSDGAKLILNSTLVRL